MTKWLKLNWPILMIAAINAIGIVGMHAAYMLGH
jgi:hypothetical protein